MNSGRVYNILNEQITQITNKRQRWNGLSVKLFSSLETDRTRGHLRFHGSYYEPYVILGVFISGLLIYCEQR